MENKIIPGKERNRFHPNALALVISLLLLSALVHAQEVQIKGQVVSKVDNEVLPFVSVVVKGTTVGTMTDVDGNFEITSPDADGTLIFSFVGMETLEVEIAGQSEINVSMGVSTEAIDEVVVVGYGTQKKANLSGAVNQVKLSSINSRPITNIAQGLQGLVPNLNIDMVGGEPGSSPNFNIRGFTSINGGTPFILIDGVPSTTEELNRLNPTDIESLSVLKDASSAAIYGARAAFGVILLTTKEGRKEGVNVDYNGSFSLGRPTVLPEPVKDPYYILSTQKEAARDWQELFNPSIQQLEYAQQRSQDPSLPSVIVDPNDPEKWFYAGNFDWYDFFLNDYAKINENTLSVHGRSQNVNYFFSGNYMNQNGLIKIAEDRYDRLNLRSKLEFKVTDWLSLSNNTVLINTNRNRPSQDILYGIYYPVPVEVPYNPDGTWSDTYGGREAARVKEGGTRNEETNGYQTTLAFTTRFFKDALQIKGDYTYKRENSTQSFTQKKVYYSPGPGILRDDGTNNSAWEWYFNDRYSVANLYASYSKTLNKHYIYALAGYNQESRVSKNFWAERAELISDDLPSIELATGEMDVGADYYDWAIRGAFFRFNYIFDGKYIVELNSRYDGSSRFPQENRFGFFPSFSGAWRMSEESFMDFSENVLSNLKLRGSWGVLGNQQIGPYDYLEKMSTYKIGEILGGTRPVAVGPPQLVAQNFTWETVTTKNAGIDIGIFANKLTVEYDYYVRDTKNMLTTGKELPAVLGASEPKENAADLQTKGWELSINLNHQFFMGESPFVLTGRFILSDSRTFITRFDNPSKLLSQYYEGYEIGTIWGLENDGYFNSVEEIESGPDQRWLSPWGRATQVGWTRYVDQNNDGYINDGSNTVDDPGDLKIIGNTSSRYRFGFDLTGNWKGIDLRIFLQGIAKKDFYPQGYFYWGQFYKPYQNTYEHMKDQTWTEENMDAPFPRNTAWLADVGGKGLSREQTQFLLNAGYIRLKNLMVGYQIPERITSRIGIEYLRIYFSGENLWEWSGLTEVFDPEAVNDAYWDWGWVYPFQRRYSIGINVQF